MDSNDSFSLALDGEGFTGLAGGHHALGPAPGLPHHGGPALGPAPGQLQPPLRLLRAAAHVARVWALGGCTWQLTRDT